MSILKSLLIGSSINGSMCHAANPTPVDQDLVDAVKDAFKDAKGRDLKLPDYAINGIASSDKWEDMDDEEKIAALLKAEETALQVSVTDPGISVLVAKIDDAAEAQITECIEAVMNSKTTAVDIYATFKRIYTKEDMDGMPYPGTDKDHVTDNQKPDIIKRPDNTGKMITTVWTNDFCQTMGRGKEFQSIIDDVKKEQKAPGSVPHLKGKGKQELAAMLSDATARRNALRSMVKRAISVHHQWEAINAMPLVTIQWIKGKSGGTVIPDKHGSDKGRSVTGSPKPIWIFNSDDPGNGRDFSVTQMLAFDPAKALNGENGGNMADLIATAATGADTPTGEAEKGVDDFINDVVDYADMLNKRENMALLLTKVAPLKDKEDTSADDLLVSVCGLYLNLADIYKKNKNRYEALINKDDDADRKVA